MTGTPAQSGPDLSRVQWHGAGSDAPVRALAGPDARAAWQMVKQNTRRTVYRVEVGPASYFVKHDHPQRFLDRLTCLWRCKAEQEFRAGERLAKAAVPVVRFVAWGRKGVDSFLVSEGLQDAIGFGEAWAACRLAPRSRRDFLAGLTEFLKVLLQANVAHPDLHTGNVLVTVMGDGTRVEGRGSGEKARGTGGAGRVARDGGEGARVEGGGWKVEDQTTGAEAGSRPCRVRFHLVDVYGAQVGTPLSMAQGLQTLGLALALGRDLESAEGAAVLEPLGLSPGAADSAVAAACWRGLVHGFFRRVHRSWPGRKRRLLGTSSLCERHRTVQGAWLLRRPFPLERAQALLEQHLGNVKAWKNMVKDDVKRQLSRAQVRETTYVVKEFFRVPPGPDWFRPDRAAWLNAYRLEMAHIPCAACHGWLRATDGRGFLILEDLGPTTLLGRLEEKPPAAERKRLTEGAGCLTAWLHGAGLAPGDLTPANLMLAARPGFGTMPLTLVDYDRILVYPGEVPVVRRAHNLRQLLELLRPLLPAEDCVRLIQAYSAEAALGEAEEAYYVATVLS